LELAAPEPIMVAQQGAEVDWEGTAVGAVRWRWRCGSRAIYWSGGPPARRREKVVALCAGGGRTVPTAHAHAMTMMMMRFLAAGPGWAGLHAQAAWKLKNNSKPRQAGALVCGRILPNKLRLLPHEYLAALPVAAFYEWLFAGFNLLVHMMLVQYGLELQFLPNWIYNMEVLLKICRYMPREKYETESLEAEGAKLEDGVYVRATMRMLRCVETAFRVPFGALGVITAPPNPEIDTANVCMLGDMPAGVFFGGEVYDTAQAVPTSQEDEVQPAVTNDDWAA
jgi:hypothetical protein